VRASAKSGRERPIFVRQQRSGTVEVLQIAADLDLEILTVRLRWCDDLPALRHLAPDAGLGW